MERATHYCPIVEQRRFREVCEWFVSQRKQKKQLPTGNFACSAAINGNRCPIKVELYPIKVRRKRVKQK